MHGLTWRRVAIYALATLPLATIGGFMLPAQAHQQDASQQSGGDAVADAARKAREQKKKDAVKPKKVYTDDDVNHLTSGTTTATAETTGAPEASAEGAAKTGEAQAEAGKTGEPEESPEVKWRKRFREVYASLARAEKEVDILQREGNKAQTQYYSDPQKALQEQYSRKDINEKDTKIAAKKKEIEQLKQQINDMQDELRKSGGDPGWGKE